MNRYEIRNISKQYQIKTIDIGCIFDVTLSSIGVLPHNQLMTPPLPLPVNRTTFARSPPAWPVADPLHRCQRAMATMIAGLSRKVPVSWPSTSRGVFGGYRDILENAADTLIITVTTYHEILRDSQIKIQTYPNAKTNTYILAT